MRISDWSSDVCSSDLLPGLPPEGPVRLRDAGGLPYLLPGIAHGLRSLVNAGFSRVHVEPNLVAEIDGLDVLMDLVRNGFGATIQQGADRKSTRLNSSH